MMDKLNEAFRFDPIFPETFCLDFWDPRDQISTKALKPEYFDRPDNLHSLRFIHIDVGLTRSRLGFACCYISGFREVRTPNPNDPGRMIIEVLPEIRVEFAFGLEAKPGQEIPLDKVRSFILWLRERRFAIGLISTDGYQSAYLLQLLARHNFEVEEISVDRSSESYVQLRQLVYEGLVSLPKGNLLWRELTDLELSPDGKKVDHSPSGSKDISDAVCGGVRNAMKREGSVKQFWQLCNPPPFRENMARGIWRNAPGPRPRFSISEEMIEQFWPEQIWPDKISW